MTKPDTQSVKPSSCSAKFEIVTRSPKNIHNSNGTQIEPDHNTGTGKRLPNRTLYEGD